MPRLVGGDEFAQSQLDSMSSCDCKLFGGQGSLGYTVFMVIKRTSHAVYDTKYHLVWAPKYRKWILRGDIQHRTKELFIEIAKNHDIYIDIMEIAADHVHLFASFPPRYSIARVVGLLKNISASVLFREFSDLKRYLWGGEFWEDGYFARTVGDKVTADVIRRYIQYHQEEEKTRQLKLFRLLLLDAPPCRRGASLELFKLIDGKIDLPQNIP